MTNQSISSRYLILAGAPKCGTTSLFRYLSDHPNICPSPLKETYFFAREFDLGHVCKIGNTLSDFETYFEHCNEPSELRLESTPYTMYANDAAGKIASLLSDVSILFLLRNPVERFVSDYRFLNQRGHPSTTGSIREFFEWQKWMKGDIPNSIAQGHYIKYIHKFLDVFGPTKVYILIFEELISNPEKEMGKLCTWLGINDTFYNKYDFKVHNETINYRFFKLNQMYLRIEPKISKLRRYIINKPKLYKIFEQLISSGKTLYRFINKQKSSQVDPIPADQLSELAQNYLPYNEMLSAEIGRSLPWESETYTRIK